MTMRTRTALAIAFALFLGAARGMAAEDRTIPLAVEEAGFAPAEVEAPTGARVRLEVTNRTAAAIEFESFELNRERVIQPGQTAAVYVSGLDPGRYEFFDDFHHQRRGALLVR
ncbi:MAG: cupredoxin domain-containing protein [Deltaproteobacteria bacterium]|nr:MAG: cupredoxin domain-containing protein [Deltaproteobacteria bacterium]TMA67643.1 MAG: cupredoxin domain-containing protein [Deltaproteobacteria bacterium]TMB40332.1 MAG: cupredoxin domain-containing protein [Deltaproteobacteria bacterium]